MARRLEVLVISLDLRAFRFFYLFSLLPLVIQSFRAISGSAELRSGQEDRMQKDKEPNSREGFPKSEQGSIDPRVS